MSITTMKSYNSYLFRDPLLAPKYLEFAKGGTPINLTDPIDINVYGDDLLYLYITVLDEEIFADTPEGLSPIAEAKWDDDDWQHLAIKLMDESRKHAWCVVQMYDIEGVEEEETPKDDANDSEDTDNDAKQEGKNEEDTDSEQEAVESLSLEKRWRVFTIPHFTEYLTEDVKDSEGLLKKKLVGMKFEWVDYLGNQFKEELRFDDQFTYLVKFKEGDGLKTFAFPDLSNAIMSLAFQIRQIKGQLSFAASKPSFQHFKYGKAATTINVGTLVDKVRGVSATAAIGAPPQVLEEITTIKNENIEIITPALAEMYRSFAGVTRLPLLFFLGAKEHTGLSDIGMKGELAETRNKKEKLLKRYVPCFQDMFQKFYEIEIEDMEIPQDVTLEEIEEEDDDKNGNDNTDNMDDRTIDSAKDKFSNTKKDKKPKKKVKKQ